MSSLFVDNDGKMNWKKIGYHARSAFAVILSFAVLIGGAYVGYQKAHEAYVSYKTENDYPGPGGKEVVVTIDPESTGNDIANVLLDADVIKSRKAFMKAYSANEQAKSIQAGTYKLPTKIPASDAVAFLLDKKHVVRNQVTVPEGLWLTQIFDVLSKKTKIPVAEFEKVCTKPQSIGLPSYATSCEGYLFPNTYEIGQKPTAQSILKIMADQFNTVAKENKLVEGAKALGRTPNEVMVVASIVQAEVPDKYMPAVSGVVYNRLAKPMRLQLDSTAHYAFKIPMNKPLPAGFTDKYDAYNTYTIDGLPPTPVNGPGEAAIKAALHPTKSDYLFFVTVNFKTKETKFAKDDVEHMKYVKEFDDWCAKSADKSGCQVK